MAESATKKAPGHFKLVAEDEVADHKLFRWALFNTEGDLLATSAFPTSAETARKAVQWLIDNAGQCVWDDRINVARRR